MDYLEKFGIERFINAHDTITLYGGSRMSANALEAACQIASVFVDFEAVQRTLGEQIAQLTHNEGAFICGGAAAGVQLVAAVFIAKGSDYAYRRLPCCDGNADEFIVFHSNKNAYAKSIEAAGGKIVLVGDTDEIDEVDVEGAISERTAGIFLFPNASYDHASLSLRKTAEIAHRHNIPVAVDAAAYLPPVENLWKFTEEGADLVVFSGGKTLSGPQSSGLIVGKKKYIEDCIRFGEPQHGVCRSAKVSREAMIALRVAIEEFVSQSTDEYRARMLAKVQRLMSIATLSGYDCSILDHGSVGQSYPRLAINAENAEKAAALCSYMRRRRIFIGKSGCTVIISVQNLSDSEVEIVGKALSEYKEEENG